MKYPSRSPPAFLLKEKFFRQGRIIFCYYFITKGTIGFFIRYHGDNDFILI